MQYTTIMDKNFYRKEKEIMYSCKYHVIWCTKYRRKVLVGEIITRLKELIELTCSNIEVDIIKIELFPEHVYLNIEVSPLLGIHKAVKKIKGDTSRNLTQEFSEIRTKLPTLWTNSYFVSTEEKLSPQAIKDYIAAQKNTWRK